MFFYTVYNLHKNDLYKSGIILHTLHFSRHHFRAPRMSPSCDGDSQGRENRKFKGEDGL
jgi:hypothetical protein